LGGIVRNEKMMINKPDRSNRVTLNGQFQHLKVKTEENHKTISQGSQNLDHHLIQYPQKRRQTYAVFEE